MTSKSQLTFLVQIICVLSCVCTTAISSAQQPGKKAAEAFATKVLDIYRKKDVAQLLALSEKRAPSTEVLEQYAPGTSRYKSLFSDSSWRWNAVSKWDGKLGEVRYSRRALVEFASDKSSGELNCVGMEQEGGKWKFSYMSADDPRRLADRFFNKLTGKGADKAMFEGARKAAVGVLRAFQKRDVDAVLKMSVAEGPMELMYLSSDDQQKPKGEFLFSERQYKGVAGWSGSMGSVYISEMACVEFARSDSEAFVVTMQKAGSEWKLEDIHSPDITDFEAMNAK